MLFNTRKKRERGIIIESDKKNASQKHPPLFFLHYFVFPKERRSSAAPLSVKRVCGASLSFGEEEEETNNRFFFVASSSSRRFSERREGV